MYWTRQNIDLSSGRANSLLGPASRSARRTCEHSLNVAEMNSGIHRTSIGLSPPPGMLTYRHMAINMHAEAGFKDPMTGRNRDRQLSGCR